MKIRDKDYTPIVMEEAGINFILPKKDSKLNNDTKIGKSMSVFYNPRMILNRDLTICIVNAYAKFRTTPLSYCDSMAATGIRAIRLLKHCKSVEKVYINDLNPVAIEIIAKNLEMNAIRPDQYELTNQDAKSLLFRFHEKNESYIDIIDIDPFGSPNHYVPAAMQAISVSEVGGLLCITATDTPVLFGIKKEACIRKYLTSAIRTDFIKEMGTRILIYFLAKIANMNELFIHPILSISASHFVRVFCLVKKGIQGVNTNIRDFGMYTYCRKCLHRSAEKFDYEKSSPKPIVCPSCGQKMIQSGLLWLGKLHDIKYFKDVEDQISKSHINTLPSYKQLKKFIELATNEDNFPPYYYSIPKVADSLNRTYPSMQKLQEKLLEKGYKSTRTHFDPQAIKTDASVDILKKILMEYNS